MAGRRCYNAGCQGSDIINAEENRGAAAVYKAGRHASALKFVVLLPIQQTNTFQ